MCSENEAAAVEEIKVCHPSESCGSNIGCSEKSPQIVVFMQVFVTSESDSHQFSHPLIPMNNGRPLRKLAAISGDQRQVWYNIE